MGNYSLLYIREEKYLQYNTGDAIHTYNQESFFSVGSLSVGLKVVRKRLHALHLPQHGTLGASESCPPVHSFSSQALLPWWWGWGLAWGSVPLEERGALLGVSPEPPPTISTNTCICQSLGHPAGVPHSSTTVPKARLCSYKATLSALSSHGEFPVIWAGMISSFGVTVRGRWEKENLWICYLCAFCCALKHVITLKHFKEFDNIKGQTV